jgi:hypothetical protein
MASDERFTDRQIAAYHDQIDRYLRAHADPGRHADAAIDRHAARRSVALWANVLAAVAVLATASASGVVAIPSAISLPLGVGAVAIGVATGIASLAAAGAQRRGEDEPRRPARRALPALAVVALAFIIGLAGLGVVALVDRPDASRGATSSPGSGCYMKPAGLVDCRS